MDHTNQEPVLVVNPLTNRHINITPMFRFLNEVFEGELHEVVKQLNRTIEMVVLYTSDDMRGTDEFADNMLTLFTLRDIFDCMEEYKCEKHK